MKWSFNFKSVPGICVYFFLNLGKSEVISEIREFGKIRCALPHRYLSSVQMMWWTLKTSEKFWWAFTLLLKYCTFPPAWLSSPLLVTWFNTLILTGIWLLLCSQGATSILNVLWAPHVSETRSTLGIYIGIGTILKGMKKSTALENIAIPT